MPEVFRTEGYVFYEPGVQRVWLDAGMICMRLRDEREIRFPASKNRRLRMATAEQLNNVQIICDGTGLHWPDLDEDLSIQGILEGRLGPQ